MLAPVIHILPLTKMNRERLLPIPGRVVVRQGQQVVPGDVVAEAILTPRHVVIDLLQELGVPAAKADAVLQCQVGEVVDQGKVIAGPIGFSRRVVESPVRGKVMAAGDGKILLQAESPPFELTAGFPGTISEIIEGRGVLIENIGALVQGAWGNGLCEMGMLHVLAKSPDHELTLDQMDIGLRGSILLAGYCESDEVLHMARELSVRAIVLASMPAALLPVAEKQPYPIIVLEGFGRLAMNEIAFRLLSTNHKNDVAVNAQPLNHFAGRRPELFIPLSAGKSVELPVEVEYWRSGLQVRITSGAHAAQIGSIVTLLSGLTAFPNGVRTAGAVVRLQENVEIQEPLSNLEVVA